MKKYLFGILAIAMAIGFSAFTTKKAHKFSTLNSTLYYKNSTCEQSISTATNQTDCRDDGMTSAYAFAVSGSPSVAVNWQTSSNSAVVGFGGNYIASFDYDNNDYATTGALVSALQSYFNANSHTFPADDTEFELQTNKYVKIHRANAPYPAE